MDSKKKKILLYTSSFIVMLIAVISIYNVYFSHIPLIEIYSSTERFKEFVLSYGNHAVYMFIFLQSLQVILAPIPGELTGSLSGLLFGGFYGAIYATAGLAVGSTIAFTAGKIFGKPFVEIMIGKETIEKYDIVADNKKIYVIFVVFFIPGIPKDALTYFFSLSNVGFIPFFFANQIARIPGTLMLTYGASAFFSGNWFMLFVVGIIVTTFLSTTFFYRKKILLWLKTP